MATPRSDARPSGSAPKQPYRTPRLAVYGDLAALTRSKSGTRADGHGKPRTRAAGAKS